jgi:hypothetical protein
MGPAVGIADAGGTAGGVAVDPEGDAVGDAGPGTWVDDGTG